MDSFYTGEEPALLLSLYLRGAGAARLALGDKPRRVRIVGRNSLRQRMIRRDCNETGAEDRVRTGGEDFNLRRGRESSFHPRVVACRIIAGGLEPES